MNIKSIMKENDCHMVIQPAVKRYKLFNARGELRFSGIMKLHAASLVRNPLASQGQLVLTCQPDQKALHVSHLGSYNGDYVDACFVPVGRVFNAGAVATWTNAGAVFYEMGDLEYRELLSYAKHLDSCVYGMALDDLIKDRDFPVVYVSYV